MAMEDLRRGGVVFVLRKKGFWGLYGGGGVGRYKGMESQSGIFDRTAEMGLKISIGMTDYINKFFYTWGWWVPRWEEMSVWDN